MANDNKLTLVLVVVVGLLAVVAIIISAVSMSKNMPPTISVNNPSPSGGAPSGSQGQGQVSQQPVIIHVPSEAGSVGTYRPPMGPNGRIYSFFIGHGFGSHGYFDDEGYLGGFGVGLIDMVCEAAEIDCRMVWLPATTCWYSTIGEHSSGGPGLHGRWYDACVGWYTTLGRTHVFQFSQPYLKAPTAHFLILSGKTFDTSKENILKSKILLLNAWSTDEKCMARETGAVLYPPSIAYAQTSVDGLRLLRNISNGFDAIFVDKVTYKSELAAGILEDAGPAYNCYLAGGAIMARKDNDDVIMHWNRGFTKLKNNGRFKKYCEMANAEHMAKGTVECIDS